MTDITCKSTDCKFNSATALSEMKGTCMLQHIEVSNGIICKTHETDYSKPENIKDDF